MHRVSVKIIPPVEISRTRRWYGGWRIHYRSSQYQACCYGCGWVGEAWFDHTLAIDDSHFHRDHPEISVDYSILRANVDSWMHETR